MVEERVTIGAPVMALYWCWRWGAGGGGGATNVLWHRRMRGKGEGRRRRKNRNREGTNGRERCFVAYHSCWMYQRNIRSKPLEHRVLEAPFIARCMAGTATLSFNLCCSIIHVCLKLSKWNALISLIIEIWKMLIYLLFC